MTGTSRRHSGFEHKSQGGGFRVPTIQKIGDLLQLFVPPASLAGGSKPLHKLQEIAKHLQWDDGTTHRFLVSLAEIGVLERTNEDEFSVGVLMVQLASVYISANQLRIAVMQKVDDLCARTGLTAEVGALHASSMVIVASKGGATPLVSRSMLGERLPLHATAGGKAILAKLTDQEIQQLCKQDFVRLASNTRTTMEALMIDIQEVRSSGMARSTSELAEGLSGLAVPIPAGCFGSCPAALICSGPAITSGWEIAEQELRAFVISLQDNLSQGLGYL
jgi:DNA-binding IclR family transcriptional regulator